MRKTQKLVLSRRAIKKGSTGLNQEVIVLRADTTVCALSTARRVAHVLMTFMTTINEGVKKDDSDGLLPLIRRLENEVQRLVAENNQLKAENAELAKANDFLDAIRGRDKLDEK